MGWSGGVSEAEVTVLELGEDVNSDRMEGERGQVQVGQDVPWRQRVGDDGHTLASYSLGRGGKTTSLSEGGREGRRLITRLW